MKTNAKILSALLLLSVVIFPACSRKNDSPVVAPEAVDLSSITDMIVTLVTRTGATDPAYAEALSTSAESSAVAFQSSINDDQALKTFINALPPLLSTFRTEYSVASTSTGKGTSADHLFRGMVQSADVAGIPGEHLELALLSAFSDLQAKFATPPFSTSFSVADRELANLLMIASTSQVHRRFVLKNRMAAITILGVDQALSDHFIKTTLIMDEALLNELSGLEEYVITDPLVRADSAALIIQQWNCEAAYDLFLFRYHMELAMNNDPANVMWDTALDRIIGRMDAVGGVMSSVTVSTLIDSGVSGGTDPYLTTAQFFVYDWVRTDMPLSYQLSTGLADEVLALGGSVPAPPTWTPFVNPYLAVFQLKYDLDLANLIDGLEQNQATAALTSPLPMQGRYALRKAQYDRRHQILSRLSGAMENERNAIRDLFASPH